MENNPKIQLLSYLCDLEIWNEIDSSSSCHFKSYKASINTLLHF